MAESENAAKEIKALEAKREELEKLLKEPQRYEGEWHAIRGQIKAINEQITGWLKLLVPPPLAPVKPTAFKLTTLFKRGASFLGLRQNVFTAAQDTFAYDAEVTYTGKERAEAITGASDLQVVLYFEQKEHALRMRNIIYAAPKRWRSLETPLVSIEECPGHALKTMVREVDYDSQLPSDREPWDASDVHRAVDDETSVGTTVSDEEVINRESIVDPKKAHTKFHAAHIDAALKNTPKDNASNILPLPADWHLVFGGETPDGVPSLSIIVAPKTRGGRTKRAREEDEIPLVALHVMFRTPQLALQLSPELKSAEQIRPQVYKVTIHKANPKQLEEYLLKRHNKVMMRWDPVP